MLRSNSRVVAGQIWRSSDPRRLTAFRVVHVATDGAAVVDPIYPARGPFARKALSDVPLDKFRVTGPKGYTLMRDAA